jgi:hypothetical protein
MDHDYIVSTSKQSLKWSKYIRSFYPTMLFYFSQTHDDTIVIYYMMNGLINTVYTKLGIGHIEHAKPLPSYLQSELFHMNPIQGKCSIPGFMDLWNISPNHRLEQGNHVLVNIAGIIDTSMNIKSFMFVYVDKESKSLQTQMRQCPLDLIKSLHTMRNINWNSFKNVVGLSS